MSRFLIPDWPAPANVRALSTTRSGGVSRPPYDDGAGGGGLNLGVHVGDDADAVSANRALLRAHLPSEPAWLTQVHGTQMLDASAVDDAPQADGSIATKARTVCVVQTADCLPVLLCDVSGTVVAAAHAGWRGLAGGILEHAVQRMRKAGATDIMAWMGPAIGPHSFEVGADVRDAFVSRNATMMNAFKPRSGIPGKYLADIYLLARMALDATGVSSVHGGMYCTVAESGRFYSYRRSGVTGRMASLIWLT